MTERVKMSERDKRSREEEEEKNNNMRTDRKICKEWEERLMMLKGDGCHKETTTEGWKKE